MKPKHVLALSTGLDEVEPTSFTQASKHSKWCKAMFEEYNALIANNTWDLVPSQPSQNLVGSKWVYRAKYKFDGIVERYKARLVAQGFTNKQVLITMRLSALLLNLLMFTSLFRLLSPLIRSFVS